MFRMLTFLLHSLFNFFFLSKISSDDHFNLHNTMLIAPTNIFFSNLLKFLGQANPQMSF